jgi:hypothetical protein
MIEVPDRDEVNEVMPQGPIITSHRFAALSRVAKGSDPTMAAQI